MPGEIAMSFFKEAPSQTHFLPTGGFRRTTFAKIRASRNRFE